MPAQLRIKLDFTVTFDEDVPPMSEAADVILDASEAALRALYPSTDLDEKGAIEPNARLSVTRVTRDLRNVGKRRS